ncbi:choline transporter, partial [Pseudoalteromonas sp. SIMBA_153]
SALHNMNIDSALPFAIIMLIDTAGLWRALRIEGHRDTSLQAHSLNSRNIDLSHQKCRLAVMVNYPNKEKVHPFIG